MLKKKKGYNYHTFLVTDILPTETKHYCFYYYTKLMYYVRAVRIRDKIIHAKLCNHCF